ncbi:phosphatase PAP2 family protein [Aquimarina longa]|uniref:phosphatase PAP2 family protein n=1 Tax=Aquimarina longa TaxID=1080221 RepID=UPI000784A613|nr:phosphatase PAP2 family protein [Aquimarina longa]
MNYTKFCLSLYIKNSLPIVVLFLYFGITNAQFTTTSITDSTFNTSSQIESTPRKRLFLKRILPITLISTGIFISSSNFEKSLQQDLRKITGDDFYSNVDDYTRYTPVIEMYTADIIGIKSKNHWFDQTKNLILSSIISKGTTALLKKEISKNRPGASTNTNSFPSGHTSTAFTTATVVYEEFKNSNLLIAYSGYFFAIATGSLRMLNNMHYLSDVLVGSGIGIISVQLVYHFDHLISWNPFKKSKGLTFIPQFNKSTMGFYFTKTF